MAEQEDRFEQTVAAINTALGMLPEFYALLEERRQQGGMTTADILTRAGARFDENELRLLEDLARLNPGAAG